MWGEAPCEGRWASAQAHLTPANSRVDGGTRRCALAEGTRSRMQEDLRRAVAARAASEGRAGWVVKRIYGRGPVGDPARRRTCGRMCSQAGRTDAREG